MSFLELELGNIMILSYIVILKCHDNRYRRDFFSIVILPIQYYHSYHGYRMVYYFKPCKFYVIIIEFHSLFNFGAIVLL